MRAIQKTCHHCLFEQHTEPCFWHQTNVEDCVEYGHYRRHWRQTLGEKAAAFAAAMRRYAEKHPKASRAQRAVHWAVKVGHLVRPETCEQCGKGGRIDGHHPDYTRPLDVVWLCRSCHGLTRRKPVMEAEDV